MALLVKLLISLGKVISHMELGDAYALQHSSELAEAGKLT